MVEQLVVYLDCKSLLCSTTRGFFMKNEPKIKAAGITPKTEFSIDEIIGISKDVKNWIDLIRQHAIEIINNQNFTLLAKKDLLQLEIEKAQKLHEIDFSHLQKLDIDYFIFELEKMASGLQGSNLATTDTISVQNNHQKFGVNKKEISAIKKQLRLRGKQKLLFDLLQDFKPHLRSTIIFCDSDNALSKLMGALNIKLKDYGLEIRSIPAAGFGYKTCYQFFSLEKNEKIEI